MRQLWSSGWLHNRIRVVCASFLVKNLLLPWQWGLKHYWDALLDADLECAALGWQFVSGCLAGKGAFHLRSGLVDPSRQPKQMTRLSLSSCAMAPCGAMALGICHKGHCRHVMGALLTLSCGHCTWALATMH